MKKFYSYRGIGQVYVNDIGATKYLITSDKTVLCAYNALSKTTTSFINKACFDKETRDAIIEDFCLDYNIPFPTIESSRDLTKERDEIYKMHAHIVNTYYNCNPHKYEVEIQKQRALGLV